MRKVTKDEFDRLCFLAHVVYERYGEKDKSGAMKDVNSELVGMAESIAIVDAVINPFRVPPWSDPSIRWVCEEHPTKEQSHRRFFGLGRECGGAGMPDPSLSQN